MKNNIKTDWNFKLFYKGDNDPQIEKDFLVFERAVLAFEKKYRKENKYLVDPNSLLKVCQDYEKLTSMTEYVKPYFYFNLRRDVDSSNELLNAKANEYQEKLNKLNNRIIFFGLSLGKIEKNKQLSFLKDSKLKKYHYYLKKIFEDARYNLSEEEEKIINLYNIPANFMWADGFSKVLSEAEIKFKGKVLPIAEALGIMSNLKTKDRRAIYNLINKKLKELSPLARLK